MKKSLLPILVFLFTISCRDDEPKKQIQPVKFSEETITAEDFSICSKGENIKCPEIDIEFLKAYGPKQISEKINEEIENHHSRLFITSEEDRTFPSLRAAVKNFISEAQLFQQEYAELSNQYELKISDEIIRQTDSLMVVKTKYYVFSGGAHGYGATNFLNFNLKNGKRLNKKDLISDISRFKDYAEKQFRKKYGIPEAENINSTGFFFNDDIFTLPENIAIFEDEVVLIYSPYEIASFAWGEMILRFPKENVNQWLKFE